VCPSGRVAAGKAREEEQKRCDEERLLKEREIEEK
jgi:hypothetical protein